MKTILLALLLIISCTRQTDEIAIGVNFPLSGGLAVYGTPLLEGLQLGVDDVNQNGGVNGKEIKLIIEDNQGNPARAATAAEKLIQQDDVDLIVSTLVGPTGAIAPITEQNNKILLYAAAVNNFAEQNKLVFKDSVDAYVDCDVFAQNFKGRRIALFGAHAEFTDKCEDAFVKNEVSVSPIERYTKGVDVDYRTPLQKIKAAKPDAIVLITYSDDCVLIWKTVEELGIQADFLLPFTQTSCGDEKSAKVIPLNIQAIGLDFVVDKESPEYIKFITDFRKKYNKEPTLLFFTALGYDWAHYLAKAFEQCPQLETKCISAALEKTDHTGAWGKVQFTNNHTTIRPRELVKFENSKWVKI